MQTGSPTWESQTTFWPSGQEGTDCCTPAACDRKEMAWRCTHTGWERPPKHLLNKLNIIIIKNQNNLLAN